MRVLWRRGGQILWSGARPVVGPAMLRGSPVLGRARSHPPRYKVSARAIWLIPPWFCQAGRGGFQHPKAPKEKGQQPCSPRCSGYQQHPRRDGPRGRDGLVSNCCTVARSRLSAVSQVTCAPGRFDRWFPDSMGTAHPIGARHDGLQTERGSARTHTSLSSTGPRTTGG